MSNEGEAEKSVAAEKGGMIRRGFLKGAGLSAAGAASYRSSRRSSAALSSQPRREGAFQ